MTSNREPREAEYGKRGGVVEGVESCSGHFRVHFLKKVGRYVEVWISVTVVGDDVVHAIAEAHPLSEHLACSYGLELLLGTDDEEQSRHGSLASTTDDDPGVEKSSAGRDARLKGQRYEP